MEVNYKWYNDLNSIGKAKILLWLRWILSISLYDKTSVKDTIILPEKFNENNIKERKIIYDKYINLEIKKLLCLI